MIAAVVAVSAAKSWIYGAALIAIAGLVCAIASSTLADIAAVLALLAFAGLTPAQDSSDRPLDPPADSSGEGLLVALGDSYMSGEGAAVFIAGTDEGGGNECRRASTAWPMLTGRQTPFNSVVSFACSGADSYNVRHTAEGLESVREDQMSRQRAAAMAPAPAAQFDGLNTQLDEYETYLQSFDAPPTFAPELVVLSIGGNDAGFASVGMTCLAPGSCNSALPRQLWTGGNLDRVQNRIRQVYADIDATFRSTPVAVIPYVNPIGDAAPCKDAALESGDVDFLSGFLPALNSRVEEAAKEYGFYYVSDVEDALAKRRLQLCDAVSTDRPGLNFIGFRSVGGLSEQRFNPAKWAHNSLHPNERGHVAIHEAFQRWLTAQGGTERRVVDGQETGLAIRTDRTPQSDTPRPEKSSEDDGQCDTFAFDDPNGCKQQSIDWALRQTGAFAAVIAAPTGAAVAAAAWLGSVAFFGWRRSRRSSRTSGVPGTQ